jgi:hypothetical protein
MPAITMDPIATTVAGEEPDTAANSMQASTEAIASPPGRWPTADTAKLIIRLATPPVVRKLPARMKNGIASRVNCSMVCRNFKDSEAMLSLANRKIVSKEASPSDIAIGMPTSRKANSIRKRKAVVIGKSSSRRGCHRRSHP